LGYIYQLAIIGILAFFLIVALIGLVALFSGRRKK
jgi:hypothetical protein